MTRSWWLSQAGVMAAWLGGFAAASLTAHHTPGQMVPGLIGGLGTQAAFVTTLWIVRRRRA